MTDEKKVKIKKQSTVEMNAAAIVSIPTGPPPKVLTMVVKIRLSLRSKP